jgi:hypothetical protein
MTRQPRNGQRALARAPRQLGDQPRRVKGGELGIMVALPRGLRLGANPRGGHGGWAPVPLKLPPRVAARLPAARAQWP